MDEELVRVLEERVEDSLGWTS